jgi:hypothetical protein
VHRLLFHCANWCYLYEVIHFTIFGGRCTERREEAGRGPQGQGQRALYRYAYYEDRPGRVPQEGLKYVYWQKNSFPSLPGHNKRP